MGKNLKKKKEITVDELAVMVKKGFDETSIQMKNLEERITDQLDKIEFNTNSQERRITILEDKVRMISVKIGFNK